MGRWITLPLAVAILAVLVFGSAAAQAPVGSFGIQLTKNAINTFGSSFFKTVASQITRQKFPPNGGVVSCAGNVRNRQLTSHFLHKTHGIICFEYPKWVSLIPRSA
jgi:hypothetical protein